MASRKKKKRRSEIKVDAAELNIMPFIDVFSMLNTFLLVSAAFVGLGILEVQIPFFSNSPDIPDKPQRTMSINVDIEKEEVKLTTLWSAPPVDKKETIYKLNKGDLARLHKDLVDLRMREQDADKVTVFSEDDVPYSALIQVVDTVKTRLQSDPKIIVTDEKTNEKRESEFIYEKVVIGSVVL